MERNQETFNYTYSARLQQEVENIRKNYLPPEEDKMEKLRKLHNSATQKAVVWSLVIGILGTLIMGTGMSLAMTDMGKHFGLSSGLLPGIIIGLLGMLAIALAFPIYNRVLKKERERIAPEILRLSDELIK